jgi:hypothetical protein
MSLVGEIGNVYKYFSKRIKGHHLDYMNITYKDICDWTARMRDGDWIYLNRDWGPKTLISEYLGF